MKNFNLLLATTAILSTTAFMANADELYRDSAKLNVNIALYEASKITVVEETIEFGALAATGDHSDSQVRLDYTYGRDISGSGVVAAGDDYHFGKIAVNVPTGYKSSLTLDSSVQLLTDSGNDVITFIPEATYDQTIHYDQDDTTHSYSFEYYVIGGEIDLSDAKFIGEYSGTTTVTAIVSPE